MYPQCSLYRLWAFRDDGGWCLPLLTWRHRSPARKTVVSSICNILLCTGKINRSLAFSVSLKTINKKIQTNNPPPNPQEALD